MNNLLLRALTGGLFVLSVIGSIWIGHEVFAVVMAVYLLGASYEYTRFFHGKTDTNIPSILFILYSVAIYSMLYLVLWNNLPAFSLIFVIPALFLYLLVELWRKQTHPIQNMGAGIFGFLWITFPFSTLLILSQLMAGSYSLIWVFALIWTNDTFAYLTGRLLGKHKLFERISPKKTWEGTVGGIVFALFLGFVIGHWVDRGNGVMFWMVSAAILAISAILGDLLESLMKRSLNIKDSGKILPGHGGILDRFDATLFGIPMFASWVAIFVYFCGN